MTDREKVIKGLECCFTDMDRSDSMPCRSCPYGTLPKKQNCQKVMFADILALLKEQEAKQAIKQTYHVMINRDYETPVEVTRYDWLCPTCKSLLCRDVDVIDDNYHFCKVCGQKVKWDG